MHSKAASYNTLAQLPPNKFINNQDKVLLTQEERLEALQLLGCSSWKDIEPGNEDCGEEAVHKRLNHLFMKQTNQIKYHRNEKQQAWNTSVKQCALGERAGLNQKNFQIFFHHASQYRLVHNAYYALLNDYRERKKNEQKHSQDAQGKYLELEDLDSVHKIEDNSECFAEEFQPSSI